jgi:hypothetical protein
LSGTNKLKHRHADSGQGNAEEVLATKSIGNEPLCRLRIDGKWILMASYDWAWSGLVLAKNGKFQVGNSSSSGVTVSFSRRTLLDYKAMFCHSGNSTIHNFQQWSTVSMKTTKNTLKRLCNNQN